jgi:hypothetical protein
MHTRYIEIITSAEPYPIQYETLNGDEDTLERLPNID